MEKLKLLFMLLICCIFTLSLSLTGCSGSKSKETVAISYKDIFSGQIEFKEKKISIENILDYIKDSDTEKIVDAKSTQYYSDSKSGVRVTVKNNTKKELSYKKCDIVSVEFTKDNATFPGNVKIGMTADKVCNRESGIYGSPDDFSGSSLYGLGLDFTNAIYVDKKGKKQMSIEIDSDDNMIKSITYTFH